MQLITRRVVSAQDKSAKTRYKALKDTCAQAKSAQGQLRASQVFNRN